MHSQTNEELSRGNGRKIPKIEEIPLNLYEKFYRTVSKISLVITSRELLKNVIWLSCVFKLYCWHSHKKPPSSFFVGKNHFKIYSHRNYQEKLKNQNERLVFSVVVFINLGVLH